jgi:hypothetical protein
MVETRFKNQANNLVIMSETKTHIATSEISGINR